MMTATHPAESGHHGPDVRSDLHFSIDPRTSGGIQLTLESRVAPYYGEAVRQQALDVLKALGVQHAAVTIHDEGALPFVIAAQIEAAVRRAGMGGTAKALPSQAALPAPSSRDRLRRSRLYLPGTEP